MLISRFQSGDENAYTELVNRYKDRLTNFVFYFLKDEEHSEDIVQETFIRLYEKKHYYKIFNQNLYLVEKYNMTTLITGSSGFIGTNIVLKFNKNF